ncbi:MAG: hypothetical protein V4620_14960 [Bacteroidota bacterium]
MKTLLAILLLLVLACGNNEAPANRSHKTNKTDVIPIKYSTLDKLFITGYFNNDRILDTLYQNNMSDLTHRVIDSFPDPDNNEWDSIVDYFYHQQSNIIVTCSNGFKDTLFLGTGLGLYCLINLGDLNNDKRDEIALVIDYCDYSNLNTCKIYSICNDKFILLKHFGINEGAFDFDTNPPFHEIKYFLELKNKHWFFKDYLDNTAETEEELNKMTPLKIKKCS